MSDNWHSYGVPRNLGDRPLVFQDSAASAPRTGRSAPAPHSGPRFWRISHREPAEPLTAAWAQAARLRRYSPVVCVATDPDLRGQSWLESLDGATEPSLIERFCVEEGWDVLDCHPATLLNELSHPTNRRPPTHRLYLHYVADAESISALDDWYAEEHEEMLLRSPAWCRIRRFSLDARPALVGRLVVHDVSDPHVLDSTELRLAMSTPWRQDLARFDWFGRSSRYPWQIVDSKVGGGARA